MENSSYRPYLAYTLSMTVVALVLMIGVTIHASLSGPPDPVNWVQVSIFLGIGLVTRGLSLELLDIKVSLDTPIFVAGAFHFSPIIAAWVVFAGTAGFDLCSIAAEGTSAEKHPESPWWFRSIRSVFSGSVCAALMLVCALAIDGHSVIRDIGYGASATPLYWMVPVFVIAWLPTQYLVVATAFRLRGRPWAQILQQVLLPGFVAEFTLVPLALLMVLVYDPSQPVNFMILSAVAILFIFVLRRLTFTSKTLLTRVKELEVLNAFGQMMSSTLDNDHIADRIADGVLSLYEGAKQFVLVRRTGSGKELIYVVFDGDGRKIKSPDTAVVAPIAQWILDTGMEVRGTITTQHGQRIVDGGWAGTPVVSCGEVVGAMMVCTTVKEARSMAKMHLLQLLSRQAAVALENTSLYELATVDGLTGLFVRRYFDQRLEEELHRAKRYNSSFSIVMIDVDNFKEVNDTYLHATGDKVLKMVSAIISNCIRAMDVPCRLGGDEFAIILPEAREEDSRWVAQRICESVRSLSITANGQMVSVTVSVGVAGYPECGAQDGASLLDRVDVALYRSKSVDGKDRVTGFSECA